MLCSSLDGRGVQRRMDTCICMTESLCCLPATITTLLISYTPIQDKKLRKSMATIENGFLRVPLWYSNRTHCREWREPIAVGDSSWYQPACFHKAVGGAVNDGCLQQPASAAPLSHPYSRALGLPGLLCHITFLNLYFAGILCAGLHVDLSCAAFALLPGEGRDSRWG